MRIPDILSFSFRLLTQKKLQYSLVFLGLATSTASLFFFFSLSAGIKSGIIDTAFQESNIIIVQVKPSSIPLLSQPALTEETIANIQSISGVTLVSREYPVVMPVTGKANILPFPIDFFFLRGIDESLFQENLPEGKSFTDDPNEPLPIFISPFAIDFLNSFSGSIQGFSGISPKSVIGKKGEVTFGKSSFLPAISKKNTITRKVEVVGLSTYAPLLGVAVPLSTAQKINLEIEGISLESPEYSRLFVHLNGPDDFFTVQEKLKAMDLLVSSQQEKGEELSLSLLVLQGILMFSSVLLLILSALFLFSTLSLSFLEHQKTIGILRALGASKGVIYGIFMSKGFLLALTATAFGLCIGFLASWNANAFLHKNLPDLSILPENIFLFSLWIPISLLGIVLLVTLLAVFFPAKKAANLDPLQAILGG